MQACHGPDQLRDQPTLRTRRPGRLALQVRLFQLVVPLLQLDVLLLEQTEVLLELIRVIYASKGHSQWQQRREGRGGSQYNARKYCLRSVDRRLRQVPGDSPTTPSHLTYL